MSTVGYHHRRWWELIPDNRQKAVFFLMVSATVPPRDFIAEVATPPTFPIAQAFTPGCKRRLRLGNVATPVYDVAPFTGLCSLL